MSADTARIRVESVHSFVCSTENEAELITDVQTLTAMSVEGSLIVTDRRAIILFRWYNWSFLVQKLRNRI